MDQITGKQAKETNEYSISTILAMIDILANDLVETCHIEVDLNIHENSTEDTILRSFATSHLSYAFSTYAVKGWPRCFKSLDILWCWPRGLCELDKTDPRNLAIRLPSTLLTYNNYEASLTEDIVREVESQITKLIAANAITCRWSEETEHEFVDSGSVDKKRKVPPPIGELFVEQGVLISILCQSIW